MKLTIVVPCYDEAENIPLILERFGQVIPGHNIEVILVNNGSRDNSAEVLRELLPDYPFARTVLVPVNKGYGYGIIQGLKEAEGDYVGWTHADMQTDPCDVITAFEIIEKSDSENLFVKGNRKGRSAFENLFTNGMSVFESIYFKTRLNDINAQPNIFPRDFWKSWENPPFDFSLDLYALIMANKYGLKIVRFPVLFPTRIHGEPKWNHDDIKSKWKFIRRTIEFSFELKNRL